MRRIALYTFIIYPVSSGSENAVLMDNDWDWEIGYDCSGCRKSTQCEISVLYHIELMTTLINQYCQRLDLEQ